MIMAKNKDFKDFAIYFSLATFIILFVYCVPDYYFLEVAVAGHSSAALSMVGVEAPVHFAGGYVFVGNYAVVRECTGIQVMAVFLGLILPLPLVSWKRKLLSLGLLGGLLYGANLFRVALEYFLVDTGILPWSLAHYPLSLVLGVLGVFLLVLVNNRVIPEFGEYIFSLIGSLNSFLGHRQRNQ
jgi:exosortase/archaeosortase family protein